MMCLSLPPSRPATSGGSHARPPRSPPMGCRPLCESWASFPRGQGGGPAGKGSGTAKSLLSPLLGCVGRGRRLRAIPHQEGVQPSPSPRGQARQAHRLQGEALRLRPEEAALRPGRRGPLAEPQLPSKHQQRRAAAAGELRQPPVSVRAGAPRSDGGLGRWAGTAGWAEKPSRGPGDFLTPQDPVLQHPLMQQVFRERLLWERGEGRGDESSGWPYERACHPGRIPGRIPGRLLPLHPPRSLGLCP